MVQLDPDYASKLPGYYASSRHELVDLVPLRVKRLLDVGCGEGVFAMALVAARPELEVWGIEPMPEAAAIAQSRVAKLLCGPVEAMLEQLPNGYFDCITFNDVLEHLSDPWEVLRRIRGKLARGGVIAASIPNLRHFPVIKALLKDADFLYTKQGVLDRTHLRFFTKKSIKRMLTDCGYEQTGIIGLHWTPFPVMLSVLNRLTRRSFEDMHYRQFAIQAKPV